MERAPTGWAEVPAMKSGTLVGRLLHRGTEVHFEFSQELEGPVMTRHATREFLRPLFEEMGVLTTRVPLADSSSRRFVRRLGFENTWSDDTFDYFMMTALPFGKKVK